ncbi:hypothetical protein [Mesorhizobium sp. 43Arga]
MSRLRKETKPMPHFRFETFVGDQSSIVEEDLASADLASPRAVELAKATASAAPAGADHSGSSVKVFDDAGYLVATVNFSDVLREDGPSASPINPPKEEPE